MNNSFSRQIGKMLNAREPKIVNGPQILDKYVGESEANIRKLFAEADEEEKRVRLTVRFSITSSIRPTMEFYGIPIVKIYQLFKSMDSCPILCFLMIYSQLFSIALVIYDKTVVPKIQSRETT